jgi:DNA polymerase III delta prime subunit
MEVEDMIDYKQQDTSKSLKPMHNNLIIFGPPGIGKSTLIRFLKDNGVPAFDLEWLPDLNARMEFIRTHSGFILGGADVNPKEPIKHSFKLLLTMPQHLYDERRAARDQDDISKASQRQHLMSDWTKRCDKHYHFVLDLTGKPLHIAAKGLLERARRAKIFSHHYDDVARELCSQWAHI